MDTIEFYEALANLFYALANSKKKMSLLEQKRINDIIQEQWTKDVGEISSEVVLYGIIRRSTLHGVVWRTAFDTFKKYYNENIDSFTDADREQIMRNAEDIVFASQRGAQSTVLMLLGRLFWE